MPLHSSIGSAGWRQASIPRQADHAKFEENRRNSLDADVRLVVASHDCDVTNDSYEKEPNVELLVVYPVANPMGGRMHGKNPRVIEFPIQLNGAEVNHIAYAKDKFCVGRSLLETITPDPQAQIGAKTRDLLRTWLGGRYNRSVFPDAFQARLKPIGPDIESLLDRQGNDISAILVRIEPQVEAKEGQLYRIRLYAVMPVDRFRQASLRAVAQKVVDDLGRLFRGCRGFEFIDAELRGEHQVTLDDMRYLMRFNNEYLSYGGPQDAAFLPER